MARDEGQRVADDYGPSPLDGALLALIAASVAAVRNYFGRGAIPAGDERRARHQLRPWEDVCLYADIEQAEEA